MANTTGRHSPSAHFRREASAFIEAVASMTNERLVSLRKLTEKLCRKAATEKDDASIMEIQAYQRVMELFANGVVLPGAKAAIDAILGKTAAK